MSWADENLRAYTDRVLRLKEEQDQMSADIKEVYAEAKANGFDKTIMGQLVAFLRKREKDPHKVEENGAIFDLYLHAYDSGTPLATRAHAHEAEPAHDPTTGEILDIGNPISATVSTRRNEGEGDAAQPEERGTGTHHARSTDGGDHEVATTISNSSDNRQILDEPSRADPRSAVESGAPIPQSVALALPVVTDAPEAPASPMPVEASGDPHSGEMPDIPDFLRRVA